MDAEMLAEIAHIFFLEACEHKSQREANYLLKCSRALAERAVKATRQESRPKSLQGSDS